MEKVELTGWEITINENGVKMATLNHERFINFLKYNEYLEQQVKLLATPAVVFSEAEVCDCRPDQFCRECYRSKGVMITIGHPKQT